MAEPAAGMTLTVRYFAGAAAAAGVPHEQVELPAGADVAALRAELTRRHPALAPVLVVASLLIDGVAAQDPARALTAASGVDVLPPFSGG